MPSASDIYSSGRYLNAGDLTPLGQRRTAIVHSAEVREVPDTKMPGQTKMMLSLALVSKSGQRWPKELLLNKTNTMQMVAGCGDDYSLWPGKPLEIWAENTAFQGRIVPGIKVMPAQAQSSSPLPPRPSATALADLPPAANPNSMPNWQPPSQETVPPIEDDEIPF